MCCASIHLLIGALFVFAVENEATTMISSTEITTAPVSMFIDNTTLINKTSEGFLDNFTTPNSTVALSNTTDGNTTSESPTPPPSEHPQTKNYTTDKPLKKDSQSSTKNMIKSTAGKTTTTRAEKPGKNHGPTYIIILIIVVLCLSGAVVYCCLQKNSRKYSVDLHPKQEDAQIPLSTVDVEVFDTTSVKDIQTFTPVESTEPLKDPAPVKEAEKPEGGKESADVKQENQPNVSSTQATVNTKDKMDGLTAVDLTDRELTISTKTSMESLDDALNENNSNNTGAEVNGNGQEFTEISIDTLLLK
ncbi:uncharacterized protein LOC107734559 [Sinocyclocheilus rhinocerous]|uniref:uncharacterized protein LOC107734559 n=1 Tax=Sinocyclocheilus rhinocerous TaxID=307959 RepID=UPI0007B89BEE|nr:PREDICTED: uncharacterized protein LOC107734559 [Sinocyclocheilus rhinocerous]